MAILEKIDSVVQNTLDGKSRLVNRVVDNLLDPDLTPIPDDKPGLLGYLSRVKPQLRKSVFYVDAYEEAISKAKRLFPNDSSFSDYIMGADNLIGEIRNELKESAERKERRNDLRMVIIMLVILLITIMVASTLLPYM